MGVRAILAITAKELNSYFASFIAYAVVAGFLFVTGAFFSLSVLLSRQVNVRFTLTDVAIILLFVSPAITMRLLAEEQASGTLELLVTSPIREAEIILGKYLAALVFLVVMLAATAYYPLLLISYSQPDPGPILAAYLGLFLQGAAFISLGLFVSALTRNQVVAYIFTFALLLIIWLFEAISGIFGGPLGSVLSSLAFYNHFVDFPKGVVDTKDVVFYLSVVVFGLVLAERVLESRRWR